MLRGTNNTLTPDQIRDGTKRLQTQVADAFAKLPRVRDRAELIATWDRFVCATLGLLVYFLGHRGTALWRLQMQALYLHPRYILVDDKDVGSHLRHRLLPKTAIVIDILNTYAEGLSRLSKSLKPLTLSHRGLPTLNDFGPRTQAFFDLVLYIVFFIPGIVALVWAGYRYAGESFAIREHSSITAEGPPIYPFKAVIPVAGALLLFQGVVEILRCIVCLKNGEWPSRQEDVEEVDLEKLKAMVTHHEEENAAR